MRKHATRSCASRHSAFGSRAAAPDETPAAPTSGCWDYKCALPYPVPQQLSQRQDYQCAHLTDDGLERNITAPERHGQWEHNQTNVRVQILVTFSGHQLRGRGAGVNTARHGIPWLTAPAAPISQTRPQNSGYYQRGTADLSFITNTVVAGAPGKSWNREACAQDCLPLLQGRSRSDPCQHGIEPQQS